MISETVRAVIFRISGIDSLGFPHEREHGPRELRLRRLSDVMAGHPHDDPVLPWDFSANEAEWIVETSLVERRTDAVLEFARQIRFPGYSPALELSIRPIMSVPALSLQETRYVNELGERLSGVCLQLIRHAGEPRLILPEWDWIGDDYFRLEGLHCFYSALSADWLDLHRERLSKFCRAWGVGHPVDLSTTLRSNLSRYGSRHARSPLARVSGSFPFRFRIPRAFVDGA